MSTVYPHIEARPGDEITVTLSNNLTIHGAVEDIQTDEAGGVLVLSVRDDSARPDALSIRGDLILLWRLGAPVVQRPGSGLHIPAQALPPGLLGPNSLQ